MRHLHVANLRKAYDGLDVVAGLDLEIEPGVCFGLLGPNGAGKTTTLRLRLISPESGSVSPSFTLAITPMMLTSGMFFPLDQLPPWLQAATHGLPLTHAVALVRPLMTGAVPQSISAHILVVVVYAVTSCYIALVLARRRLLN